MIGRSAVQTSLRSLTVLLTEGFVFSSLSPGQFRNGAFRQSTATLCCVFGSSVFAVVPLTAAGILLDTDKKLPLLSFVITGCKWLSDRRYGDGVACICCMRSVMVVTLCNSDRIIARHHLSI